MKTKSLLVIFLVIILFSCKKNNGLSEKQNKEVFLGDSIIMENNYFHNLNEANGYSILSTQNKLYQKKYSNFKYRNVSQLKDNIKFKFEKQFINKGKKYRIVLYTLINNIKKDSIEFYKNVKDLHHEPSNYTSLSYLDLKHNEIWQIKYFSSSVDKSVGYILYAKNKILENGKIETDSLYYLDESLDVEMEKNKLYY
ncbi:hypothetical protein [Flavobacterium sp. 245]|uniref:hypothetical protein n=1 Tax=Flavobacterium sp. 245 TaxID=2512115 RepID=UPI001060A218|nr:hypothetical protein [Flavobacterium sp. 245]TDO94966.1 hypothetical protein EV145_11555 [Flavobacterium sp. 245]